MCAARVLERFLPVVKSVIFMHVCINRNNPKQCKVHHLLLFFYNIAKIAGGPHEHSFVYYRYKSFLGS